MFSVFGPANFREETYCFAVLVYRFSGWTFMIRVPIWCNAISADMFLWFLFQSCSIFSCLRLFVYRFLCDFFLVMILELPVMYFSSFFCRTYYVVFVRLLSVPISSFFGSLSCKFPSVSDVINFNISKWVLIPGKLHSFCISVYFCQWSIGVSISACWAQKNLLVSCIGFSLVTIFCCLGWLLYLCYFFPDLFGWRVALFDVVLRFAVPKGSLLVSFFFSIPFGSCHCFF